MRDMMQYLGQIQIVAMLALLLAAPLALADAIPTEELDSKKIYWGQPSDFETPGEVDFGAVIKATPAYKSIKDDKIETGTAKYWILISKASDQAAKVVADVGNETDYDLIADLGYLGSLTDPIDATDVTDLVLEKLDEM